MTELALSGGQISHFAKILAFAIALYYAVFPDPDSKIIDTPQPQEEYDFVIIGGGTAATVIANRLSEVGHWSILVLEAGGQETNITDIPILAVRSQDTELDWQYKTAPLERGQSYCLAMAGQRCKWPRGKVLGGTSVINNMLYVRGNRKDFDDWESLGCEDWGYDKIMKYFLKSENNANPDLLQTPYHSSKGYLNVEDAPFTTPVADAFINGGRYLGYDNVDVNGERQTGFMIPQGTLRHGMRCSTSKAFIRPAQKRPNLSISMHSFVTKIGFENEGSVPTARTVSYIKANKTYTVRATKEIIVSGGAINSPQLLMLSGIGPEDHLTDLGIKVVKNLKVGYNLQDHLGVGSLSFKTDKPVTLKYTDAETPEAVFQYFLQGKGPLTSLGGIEGLGFVNTKYAHPSGLYPDIEFHLLTISMYNGKFRPIGQARYNLRPNLFDNTGYNQLQNEYLFAILPVLLRPESRGRIKLRSTDPFDHPIINPNYLASQADVDVLVEGMKLALKLVATPPFKALNAVPLTIPFPGCENFDLFSDAYLECTIRQFTHGFFHPSCTCPMGVGPDAVVDPRLQVYGVKGLRVIDASVMANITSGNIYAPTIMIAEKGADMIKEDWGIGQMWPFAGGSWLPFKFQK